MKHQEEEELLNRYIFVEEFKDDILPGGITKVIQKTSE